MTSVAIVTPWFNHPELMDAYVEAVAAGGPDELIVVDNGSTPPIDLPGVRLDENTGFCHASNVGLRHATSDVVVFLNNDVMMNTTTWLRDLVAQVEPGVLCGRMRYDEHANVDGREVPYLDGWCIAGVRTDLLDLGGFDETLEEPGYYSDNLLCLAARQAGMTLVDTPIGLTHLGNRTSRDDLNWAHQVVEWNYRTYLEKARQLKELAAV